MAVMMIVRRSQTLLLWGNVAELTSCVCGTPPVNLVFLLLPDCNKSYAYVYMYIYVYVYVYVYVYIY